MSDTETECGNTTVVRFRYSFINSALIYRQMKQVMKDEEQGRMTREDAAEALTALIPRLTQRTEIGGVVQELVLDTEVKQGLRARGMI